VRALDDATVALLAATSIRSPRDVLLECPECGCPFWAGYLRAHARRWCCTRCRTRAHNRRRYWSVPGERDRRVLAGRRYRADRRTDDARP